MLYQNGIDLGDSNSKNIFYKTQTLNISVWKESLYIVMSTG